jgi:hypothetical protein
VERARAELHEFAAGIADKETRRVFLSLPINQRIAAAT